MNFLKSDILKSAKSKIFTCTKELLPEVIKTKFGDRLRLSGEIDGTGYTYTPNNTTKDSLIDAWGADETKWIGKTILLGTEKVMTGDGMKTAIYTQKHIDESED